MKPPGANKGGGRGSCAICNHPDREAIDAQLTALIPLRKLSARYGMSFSSLSKHRTNHTSKSEIVHLRRARSGGAPTRSALDRIEDGLTALEDLMAKSKDHQYIAAYRERLRTLEIIGKAKGEFTDAPTVTINLWQTPVWQQIRVVIFEELAHHPDIRAALAKRLIALEENNPT